MPVQLVTALKKNPHVHNAYIAATEWWDSHLPRDIDPARFDIELLGPQEWADSKLTMRFGIDQWLARDLMILAALLTYYDIHSGLEGNKERAQAMYLQIRGCWSSPRASSCDQLAKALDLNVLAQ